MSIPKCIVIILYLFISKTSCNFNTLAATLRQELLMYEQSTVPTFQIAGRIKYCGRSTYSHRTHTCCSDETIVEKDANCGSTVYNKCSQLCCGNRVYEKSVIIYGKISSNLKRQCHGSSSRVVLLTETAKYCGRSTYNPRTQTCCSDESIVEKDANCGLTVYNKCSQLCCGNRVYEKSVIIYGKISSNLKRQCHGSSSRVVLLTETAKYCGRSTYNPRTQTCCSDETIVEKDANCGSTVYNKCSQLCCGNRVYEKSVIIYGKISSNLKRQCHGSSSRVVLLTETAKYCGRSTYNPRTQTCCSDESIVEKDANCGLTVYNKCSQLCCGNRVYEKSVIINGNISSNLKRQCHGSGTRVFLLTG